MVRKGKKGAKILFYNKSYCREMQVLAKSSCVVGLHIRA